MGKRFSERIGAAKPPQSLQVQDMSDALRNSLWNVLLRLFESDADDARWWDAAEAITVNFLKLPADDLPGGSEARRNWVKGHVYQMTWYQVYDLIEFVAHAYNRLLPKWLGRYASRHLDMDVFATFNRVLGRELSGYRFIDGVLTPISNPTEVAEIEQAIGRSAKSGFGGASVHLADALRLLGKKPDPDYRNATKEAISAVESVCRLIGETKSTGLRPSLDKLEARVHIHPALKAAFVQLYGYTSDEGGVRHAILEDTKVGFDEAKFMIVSCSAFVNYLISKADAAGIVGG